MIDAIRLANADSTDLAETLSPRHASQAAPDVGPLLAAPELQGAGLTREEVSILAGVARDLHASDCEILIRLIGRVAELERKYGEEVALAMLESATQYFAQGRSPN